MVTQERFDTVTQLDPSYYGSDKSQILLKSALPVGTRVRVVVERREVNG